MAAYPDNASYLPEHNLSPTQRELLLAALSSNKSNNAGTAPHSQPFANTRPQLNNRESSSESYDNDMPGRTDLSYDGSPALNDASESFDNLPLDESPFIGYDFDLEFEDGFNGENDPANGLDGEMIGTLPGQSPDGEGDLHEKRKSIDGSEEDGGGKRREGDDKVARKPGRKPLTSEPTSKRKAQNRAAQRAFRERKEKHLKDLEVKVDDLEKASEAANHENGVLRAQVDRLQTELREYRRRLSSNSNGVTRSPPAPNAKNNSSNRGFDANNFKFEFPRFGGPAGGPTFNNGQLPAQPNKKPTPTQNTKSYSMPGAFGRTNGQQGVSPNARGNGSVGNLNAFANYSGDIDGLADLFSPSVLGSVTRSPESDYMNRGQGLPAANQNNRGGSESSSGQGRTPPSQSESNGTTMTSPTASSVSHNGPTSSCGTSPEPSHQSPAAQKPLENGLKAHPDDCGCSGMPADATGPQAEFCKNLAQACGNQSNPVPPALSMPNDTSATLAKTPGSEMNSIDWLAQQNGGQFDPVLFGEYRDSQDTLASADFGTFFNEAYPLPDLGSPFGENTMQEQPIPKKDFIEEMDAKANNEEEQDEVVPGEDTSKMLNCTKIWDRLQTNASFKNGEIDVDNLCSELRKKAVCSETGVVVGDNDLEGVLAGLPNRRN
ncbi:MAG: hypothetical protein M4579_002232 [Chaenotheca gracillima]|nr:MAG: hypothetical protein M4579_002232 [Chaenotheca gracillima]